MRLGLLVSTITLPPNHTQLLFSGWNDVSFLILLLRPIKAVTSLQHRISSHDFVLLEKLSVPAGFGCQMLLQAAPCLPQVKRGMLST